MKVLPDTHAFLWWVSDPEKLPDSVLQVLIDPDVRVFLSVATSWEVQIKVGIGRLTLKNEWKDIVQTQVKKNFIEVLNITLEHTWALQELDPLHKDPFDRLLIAQSLYESLVLVSKDPFIHQYPQVSVLWG